MKKCKYCGDKFTGEEISELRSEHEQFSINPFICPDCYDRLNRMDLEEQFDIHINERKVVNI